MGGLSCTCPHPQHENQPPQAATQEDLLCDACRINPACLKWQELKRLQKEARRLLNKESDHHG